MTGTIEDIVQKRVDALIQLANAQNAHWGIVWQAVAAMGGAFAAGALLLGLALHFWGGKF